MRLHSNGLRIRCARIPSAPSRHRLTHLEMIGGFKFAQTVFTARKKDPAICHPRAQYLGIPRKPRDRSGGLTPRRGYSPHIERGRTQIPAARNINFRQYFGAHATQVDGILRGIQFPFQRFRSSAIRGGRNIWFRNKNPLLSRCGRCSDHYSK